MAKNDASKSPPPYVSFSTFASLIESLSTTAVPGKIDRSVMPKMSGVTKSQTLSALRFLGLIGSDGTVHDRFRALVKVYGTEEWPETLAELISDAYSEVIGNLDLDTGTSTQLSQVFNRNGGVSGQMLAKAIRFYLKALNEAKLTYSPYFKPPRASAPTGQKKTTKKKKTTTVRHRGENNSGDTSTPPPAGTLSYPIGNKRFMHLPIDLTDADCDAIEASMPLLRTIAKLPKGGAP